MPSAANVIPLRPEPAPYSAQAQACLNCGVRQTALFGVLSEADLVRIHHRISDRRLQPGERLYGAHEAGRVLYTLRRGMLRFERHNDRGERRIVRLAGPSDLIGLEVLLGQRYAADAVACTEVELCGIPQALIDELQQHHPHLSRDLMKRWQRALDDADEWLTELGSGPARHRMLRLLLKLSEFGDAGARVWMPTRQAMGTMLDMTVETASRLVSALRREGLIEPVDARHARVNMPRLLAELKAEGAAER